MKLLSTVLLLAATVFGLRYASQRLATHQQVLPRVLSRVNTQVHRINQR